MNDIVARLSGIAMAALLLIALTVLFVTSGGGIGKNQIQAEFENAAPLLEGMDVRMGGGIAGSVATIELTDRGTALVTLVLNDGVDPPRADASVAIRQQDLLGDSYVSLSPGTAREPLEGTIQRDRAIAMPRTDDLFNIFQKPVRQGLQALVLELGLALERRGEDLNAAILELRPGLEATDQVMRELDSQKTALRAVITDARRFTSQAAARTDDLDGSVVALDRVLASTAEHGPGLDRALERLPETLTRARSTLGRLRSTAVATRPVARIAADTAPDLRRTARLLGPFTDDVAATTADLGPTLDLLGKALDQGAPTLRELRDLDLKVLLPTTDLLAALRPVVDTLAHGLFDADSYGKDPSEVGLGAVSVEPGDQPTEPNIDPARGYLRTALVPTCELFGVKIEPGCLDDAIANLPGNLPLERGRSSRAIDANAYEGPDAKFAAPEAELGRERPLDPVEDVIDRLERQVDGVRNEVKALPDRTRSVIDGTRGVAEKLVGRGAGRGHHNGPENSTALLEFLLGP